MRGVSFLLNGKWVFSKNEIEKFSLLDLDIFTIYFNYKLVCKLWFSFIIKKLV